MEKKPKKQNYNNKLNIVREYTSDFLITYSL